MISLILQVCLFIQGLQSNTPHEFHCCIGGCSDAVLWKLFRCSRCCCDIVLWKLFRCRCLLVDCENITVYNPLVHSTPSQLSSQLSYSSFIEFKFWHSTLMQAESKREITSISFVNWGNNNGARDIVPFFFAETSISIPLSRTQFGLRCNRSFDLRFGPVVGLQIIGDAVFSGWLTSFFLQLSLPMQNIAFTWLGKLSLHADQMSRKLMVSCWAICLQRQHACISCF